MPIHLDPNRIDCAIPLWYPIPTRYRVTGYNGEATRAQPLAKGTMINFQPRFIEPRRGKHHVLWLGGLLVLMLLAIPSMLMGARQPPLRIVDVTVQPAPFPIGSGWLDFTIRVELPAEVDLGGMLIEISSLITSPSKRSMRFLFSREPIDEVLGNTASRETVFTLSWDGFDQHREIAQAGKYDYEVRAKLFKVGDKGPRTTMVSWPVRGTIEVTRPDS